MRIAGVNAVIDLPTVIIQSDGRLDRQDVAITFGHSGAENFRALRAGDVDFALMTMTPLVLDSLRDPDPGGKDDPVVLANLTHGHPPVQILSLADDGATGPEALERRRVGVQTATMSHFIWTLFLQTRGVDPERIELVPLRAVEMPAAMREGRINAAVLWEPWSSEIRRDFGEQVVEFSTDGLAVAPWMLVTRRDVVEAEPDRTEAILKAYVKTVEDLQGAPYRVRSTIAAHRPDWAPAGDDTAPAIVYQISMDWSLFRSFREQLAWARGIAGPGAHSNTPEFLNIFVPEPLSRVAPGTVSLPVAR